MRKRRTRQHVIADLSVHHVEGFVLRCGWTVERMRHDDGIDLLMQTYNVAGEVEGGRVLGCLRGSGMCVCFENEVSAMVARSGISFAELRQLLLDLRFAQSKRGKFWLFEHPTSAMTFAYRPYRAKEKVTLLDMHVTRQDLDASGLLAPEAFDDLLEKATA